MRIDIKDRIKENDQKDLKSQQENWIYYRNSLLKDGHDVAHNFSKLGPVSSSHSKFSGFGAREERRFA